MKKLLGLGFALALVIGLGTIVHGCSSAADECTTDADCDDGLRCATDSELGGAMTCRDFGF